MYSLFIFASKRNKNHGNNLWDKNFIIYRVMPRKEKSYWNRDNKPEEKQLNLSEPEIK